MIMMTIIININNDDHNNDDDGNNHNHTINNDNHNDTPEFVVKPPLAKPGFWPNQRGGLQRFRKIAISAVNKGGVYNDFGSRCKCS